MQGFVTDTMAVILKLENRRMPQAAKAIFLKAESKEVKRYVPGIVLAEIGYLAEKGRIDIKLQQVWDVIRNAFEINDIPELHDRLVAASGRNPDCPIVTNDPKIIASKFVTTLWG
jgi:predicted nucleic acid-binding protein